MKFSNAFFTLANLLALVLAQSEFAETCSGISLSGSTLSATCQGSGGNLPASIDLNNCIKNSNGILRCGGNHGLHTCVNCSLNGAVITCSCTAENGNSILTDLDLDQCIGNQNGDLEC